MRREKSRGRRNFCRGVDDWGESVYNGGCGFKRFAAETRAIRESPLRILYQNGRNDTGGASHSPTIDAGIITKGAFFPMHEIKEELHELSGELKKDVRSAEEYALTFLKWLIVAGVTGAVGGAVGTLFHTSV